MQNLANTLVVFLREAMLKRCSHGHNNRVQPVFIGPPASALREVFNILTNNGSNDWNIGNGLENVVVLLVIANGYSSQVAPISTTTLSRICNWDYAVSVRNSVRSSVTLVTPSAWDLRPESIANATETIGHPPSLNANNLCSCATWTFLLNIVASKIDISFELVKWAIFSIFKDVRTLETNLRESIPWSVVDELLGASTPNDFVKAIGLPCLGNFPLMKDSLKSSRDVLSQLAILCAKIGLQEAEQTLKNGAIVLSRQNKNLRPIVWPIRELFRHLRENAGTGTGFSSCPSWYFRPKIGADTWWQALPYEKIQRLLDEVGATRPVGKLKATCSNALNQYIMTEGEPCLVLEDVTLKVYDDNGNIPTDLEFTRRIGRQAPTSLQECGNGSLNDKQVPEHDVPIIYKINSSGYRPATIKVISLTSFGCHGYARIRNAISNPPPIKQRTDRLFEQEITVDHEGVHELEIYGSPSTKKIIISHSNSTLTFSSNTAVFPLDIEDGDKVDIVLQGAVSEVLGKWTVLVLVVESSEDHPRTRFESLVKAHQQGNTRPKPVKPIDSYVRRIEDAYINTTDSWKGVIACWSTTRGIFQNINWVDGTLGNLPIEDDVRPNYSSVNIPKELLECRDEVRRALLNAHCNIVEFNLSESGFVKLVEMYISLYLDWLNKQPEIASWVDCIALYASRPNIQAGRETPTSEPVAILLSPLHPLRLTWHCHAQCLLEDAIRTKRCPAAGLLNPRACPEIIALPFYHGSTLETWRTFFAVGCNEPYWSLLLNREYLGDSVEKKELLNVLEWLGFKQSGLTGGFTPPQVERALEGLSAIQPARAIPRIGLIGDDQESSGCVDGLINWCRSTLQVNDDGIHAKIPNSCEIYDLRQTPSYPSAASLAMLSEETSEKVLWFSIGTNQPSDRMDLVILDQLGTNDPRGIVANSRSPLAPGALFRVNIRQDLSNALILQESRIGRQDRDYKGIKGTLLKATIAIESLARNDNTSHLQFRPNQQAIGQRLTQSRFVAITSSQVDPACFIRNVRIQDAYLWDYEIPEVKGFDKERIGYYLIARPSQSMKDAIVATSHLITTNPPPLESLLEEISKRGIPVLKRLASGGSHSRGELGVLLAVRLLQDAFRGKNNSGIRLPVICGDCINLLLPVDSFWEPLTQIRRVLDPDSSEERPDLLAFSIKLMEDQPVQIKITPLEIKFRDPQRQQPLSGQEIGQALQQAANLGNLLEKLWVLPSQNELWAICSRAFLSQCLDHVFRIYADPEVHGIDNNDWTIKHEKVMHDILGGQALITVNKAGRLIIIDGSSNSSITDMDGDGRQDTVTLCLADAEYLLAGVGSLSPEGQSAVRMLDLSFPSCWDLDGLANEDRENAQNITSSQELVLVEDQQHETQTERDSVEALQPTDSSMDEPCHEVQDTYTVESRTESIVPTEIRQHVNNVFNGFIGNEPAVKRIKNDLLRALIEKPPHLSKNYLFTGQPSTGKSELAKRMAEALGLPFIKLDGRSVLSKERLFQLINGQLSQQGLCVSQVSQQAGLPVMEYPPLVVFIDEVHLVPRSLQESFLTMLEAADRIVLVADHYAKMNNATFLFATTRASCIDAAFRSRCTEIHLREYNKAEVAAIVEHKLKQNWPRDIYLEIAKLGRCVPRVAIEIGKELETEIAVSEYSNRSLKEHLEEVRLAREIDEMGLTFLDLQYLTILEHENRPVGEQALLNMIGDVDKERILDEVEPFLRRLNFIKLGRSGREITTEGKKYLERHKE